MKTINTIFFWVTLILATNSLSAAAVEISGVNVSGGITNGNVITINGNSFGSKSSPAPVISSYDHPNSANNLSNGSISGNWGTRAGTTIGSSPSYKRTPFYQNDYYVDCEMVSGDYSQLQYDGSSALGDYFYVSFWFYNTEPDFIVSSTSQNSKLWRWYTNSQSSVQELYFESGGGSASAFLASKDGGQGSYNSWVNPFFPEHQRWNHIEGYLYCGTNGNTDGFMITSLQGKSRMEWTGWGLIGPQTHAFNYFRFGQVSGANYAGGSILLSDIYIDNTQAHVFISDSSDISDWIRHSDFAHNETQVCSNWSDSSISFKFNQGSFSEGQTVYLYVVDANGNMNTPGYPITIGSAGTTIIPFSESADAIPTGLGIIPK